jgi:indole-3-glycerol phosphate synthase
MILDQIVANKLSELEVAKRRFPLTEIRKAAEEQSPPLDFLSALLGGGIKIIAEVKKASPSKGVIRSDFNPVEIARIYASNRASAISVLTEVKYFQGSLKHLKVIRRALGENRPPLLRKDFILKPYQVYESRACGADSILLIVAILTPAKLKRLLELSHKSGMWCLIEVHNKVELEIALNSGAKIIGINNRDLHTFTTDITTTERLRPFIPADRTVVSESGIKRNSDMEKLRKWGVNAALVGESLIASPDIAAKMKELLG